jgi:hypothetical protein
MIPQQGLVAQSPDQGLQSVEPRWRGLARSAALAQPGLNRAVRGKARPSASNR